MRARYSSRPGAGRLRRDHRRDFRAQVEEIFPGSLTVGAKFGVVIVPEEVAIFVRERRTVASRSRDFPFGRRLLRWPPSGSRRLHQVAARRREAPGFYDQRAAARSAKRMKFSISWADARIWKLESFARSAIPKRDSAKTNCAWFARSGSPRDLATRSSQPRCKRFRNWRRRLTRSPMERLRDELTKILTEGAARRGFELLDQTGLLVYLLPEIAKMKGVEQPPQFHPEGDVWIHTLMMIGGLPAGSSPTLAWGVLLHDVGKPPTFTPPVRAQRAASASTATSKWE